MVSDYEHRSILSDALIEIYYKNDEYRLSYPQEFKFDMISLKKQNNIVKITVFVKYKFVEKIQKEKITLVDAIGANRSFIFLFANLKKVSTFSKKEISDLLRHKTICGCDVSLFLSERESKCFKFEIILPLNKFDIQ